MTKPTKRPALTAALLNSGNASHRVARCLINGSSTRDPIATADRRLEATTAPLFCEKGAASADGFDPLSYQLLQPPALSAGSPEVGLPQRVRVWLRVDPSRRSKLKQAAADEKRTCRALLASAIEGFMTERDAVPQLAAMSLAMIGQGRTRQAATCRRHKIAIWVHPEQRDQIRAAAARLGQTVQTLLLAALDEELARVAQRIPTLSNLSSAIGDRPDSTSAVLPHPANAASVGAEIIPLRCARQAKTLAGVATIAASS